MADTLEIQLNRHEPHPVEVAESPFETHRSFDIVLKNNGPALRVYLNPGPSLSRALDLEPKNYFVKESSEQRIPVSIIPTGSRVQGRLQIVTGYGSTSVDIPILILADEPGSSVRVDERLSEPASKSGGVRLNRYRIPLILLGMGIVLLTIFAVGLRNEVGVQLGLIVLVAGIILAALLYRRAM